MDNSESLQLAREVCKHLPGYKPRLDHCVGVNCSLEHESGDGRSVFICIQDRKKWEASVTWPHERGSWYRPEEGVWKIGVSKSRGPEILAREIERRLLGAYNQEYPKQLALLRGAQNRDAHRKALRDELLALIDPGRPLPDHMQDATQLPVYNCGLRQLNVSCGEADEVELHTTYLPKAVAVKIIQLLIDEGFRKDR